jgi:hypothetical protein
MPTPSTPFAFPTEANDSPHIPEAATEILRTVSNFIRDRIISGHNGKLPPARTIAVRVIVLTALLYPDEFPSLASVARELGCSRSWLSKVGISFSASIGMRASWQRMSLRDTYSKRAKGVHAGTWTPTNKWERDKMRIAAKQQPTPQQKTSTTHRKSS